MTRILVADDEKNIRETLSRLLELDGFETRGAENGVAAQRLLEQEPFDAVILDLRMPGMDGLAVLAWMRDRGPQIPVVVVSAHGEVQDAVIAMKDGAADYVTKPFDPDDLLLRVRRAVEDHRLRRSVFTNPRAELPGDGPAGESANEAMRKLQALARRIAPSDTTVLITGESGTGKEVLARFIHAQSARPEGPFVAINLGAVPENLLESELFGYEKGAFTGAATRKSGLFETAGGGTLFLDEIGDMPVHLQVKLLRALQERKVQRVGGTTTIPIDVRIVAATNKDLKRAIQEGQFREDLYYRLNVMELHLPPLRERPEDIAPLLGHFLEQIRRRGGSRIIAIEPEVIRQLQRYRFPGNIRELENVVERAALLAESDHLTTRDFEFLGTPDTAGAPGSSTGGQLAAGTTLAALEAEAIRFALLRNEGHRERTAAELGITRRTLLNKMNEYGIVYEELAKNPSTSLSARNSP